LFAALRRGGGIDLRVFVFCRDCADELMKNDFKMKKRSEKLRFFAVYLRFIRAASGCVIRRQKRLPFLNFGISPYRIIRWA